MHRNTNLILIHLFTFKIFLAVLVVVNSLNPIEKWQEFREKSYDTIGQVKHKIDTYKANTKAKIDKMKYYMNYLKSKFTGKYCIQFMY